MGPVTRIKRNYFLSAIVEFSNNREKLALEPRLFCTVLYSLVVSLENENFFITIIFLLRSFFYYDHFFITIISLLRSFLYYVHFFTEFVQEDRGEHKE